MAYFDTSMLLELKLRDHAGAPREHGLASGSATPRVPSPAPDPAAATRLWRYLPLAIVATGLVIVLPAAVVAALVPRAGLAMTLVSAVAAIAISLILAVAGAALWKRQPRSRDVVFADLMLWCWVRRYWSERRLSQARELFESARRAGPRVNIELLLGLSRLLEARDSHIHGHSQRVARYAVRISRAMGLSEREVAMIRTAAEVHDVGKIYTPRAILNSPRPLTEAEFAAVKEHAARGAEMLTVVGDHEITAMVRHHHERIDGAGYPDGLAGSAIPLGARIIAVADTFDAITSDRPYRPARSQKHALDILSAEAGAQLDAGAVAAFEQGYCARRSVGSLVARWGGTPLLPRPGSERRRPCSRRYRALAAVSRRSARSHPRSAPRECLPSLPVSSASPTQLSGRLARWPCCSRCRARAKLLRAQSGRHRPAAAQRAHTPPRRTSARASILRRGPDGRLRQSARRRRVRPPPRM